MIATLRVRHLLAPGLLVLPLTASQNLVTKAPAANLPAMLVSALLPFCNNLATRKWSDADILEDVQFLRDELKTRFESLTCVPPFLPPPIDRARR
jgi:hypothetical protein